MTNILFDEELVIGKKVYKTKDDIIEDLEKFQIVSKKNNLDEFERQSKAIARKSTTMKILRFMQKYGGESYSWNPSKCLINLDNLITAIDEEFLKDEE